MPNLHQLFGTWSSPVSEALVGSAIRLNDVQWAQTAESDADTARLIWHESRGSQGVLMMQTGADAPHELSPALSVKGRVGYGGGEFHVHAGMVCFVANGRLYRQPTAGSGGTARPITPAFGGAASPCIAPDGRWMAFVHSDEGVDVLALVDAEGKQWARKLVPDSDFVMQPCWSPDGRQLAVITWNHPNMPWDSTRLHLMTLDDEMRVIDTTVIAGNETTSIFQPEFSPDGKTLSYISDTSGYTQLHTCDLATGTHTQITTAAAEHGTPAWIQGLRTYGWSGDGRRIYYLRNQQGIMSVWRYALDDQQHEQVAGLEAYTYFAQIAVSPADDRLALLASASDIPTRLISVNPRRGAHSIQIHRRTMPEHLPDSVYARAEPLTWTGHDGETVHGLYMPPTSEQYESSGTPPLIVYVHGGPTSQAQARFEAVHQVFATRGFALLAVNHRGSTGYGRAYAQALYGNWGVYDVEDSRTGAAYLVAQGLADARKLVILGGSAGGYTVLQSLVDYPGFYRAGVCLYGISNHFLLDTHKFEERYTSKLLGELPEAAEVYRQRSPIYHAERIADPIILFQGGEDTVVPPDQSEMMVASLKARGIPHEYHLYPDEGHGFRQPETITHYLRHTLRFLQRYVIYA